MKRKEILNALVMPGLLLTSATIMILAIWKLLDLIHDHFYAFMDWLDTWPGVEYTAMAVTFFVLCVFIWNAITYRRKK